MSKIMMRNGAHDCEAFQVAQAMENAGAHVISISYNGEVHQIGALTPSSRYIVWARVPDGLSIDRVDRHINAMIDGKPAPTETDHDGDTER